MKEFTTKQLNEEIDKVMGLSEAEEYEMLELELTRINKEPMVEFADFTQEDTNLACIIWVDGPRNLKHGLTIKFLNSKSTKDDGSELIPMTISDNPKIPKSIHTKLKLSNKEVERIKQWVILNKDVLISYSQGNIATKNLYNLLKPLQD